MVTKEKMDKVSDEMNRLKGAMRELRVRLAEDNFPAHWPAHTGAIKRASMDLTRALAELRRP